jgi:hypothetical protein
LVERKKRRRHLDILPFSSTRAFFTKNKLKQPVELKKRKTAPSMKQFYIKQILRVIEVFGLRNKLIHLLTPFFVWFME